MRAIAIVIALAACGGGGESQMGIPDAATIDAMPRQIVMENVPLVINEIVEAKLVGGPGDIARIRMTLPTPSLDWNIHAHPNGTTVNVIEEFKVMSVDYTFAPDSKTDWYLLLRNKGQTDTTVQLQIELYGEITWSGWI